MEDASRHLETFYKLVKAMRAAQVRYFQNRTGDNLKLAKDLERDVDKAVRELEQEVGEQKDIRFE